ncbi:hypothetical protein CTEN210_02636 [Chaetoceros tenuissimus]|uniref:Uncharacterized protein n=1 Tax=Chaetoceros tenuissimus TaxID=426638 RepID=A0AAD3CHF6_9STRA|nr:hypothetical protein CTEN210_02636 [Chaetoceros tenuissimus]
MGYRSKFLPFLIGALLACKAVSFAPSIPTQSGRVQLRSSFLVEPLRMTTSNSKPQSKLLKKLLQNFQGDFDNYEQVVADRQQQKLPREGGGHEHFHVTLIPLSIEKLPEYMFPNGKESDNCGALIAAYYFDGMPNRIFRLRLYSIYTNKDDTESVCMKLYTFDKELEMILRQTCDDSLKDWCQLIESYTSEHGDDSFVLLERCDIKWTNDIDEIRHSYLKKFPSLLPNDANTAAIHAVMINDHEKGGVLLESQMAPGTYLRIQDELSLWNDLLLINDRGHDADNTRMVYGNWEGVPYQMKRVTNLVQVEDGSSFEREVVKDELQWTLGSSWRTEDEFLEKLKVIGGTTTKQNQNEAKT